VERDGILGLVAAGYSRLTGEHLLGLEGGPACGACSGQELGRHVDEVRDDSVVQELVTLVGSEPLDLGGSPDVGGIYADTLLTPDATPRQIGGAAGWRRDSSTLLGLCALSFPCDLP
jgi:hypothetical protein